MHGKIMVYIEATGRGTVKDMTNIFYDFNRQNWHDKKSMPSVGVFVEFRSDGKRITSLNPSRFQEFREGDFITEQDFWRTDNDDELEDVQNTKRSTYVTQLFRTTDFDALEHIPLTLTIPQAIQNYFQGEILAVEALKSNMEAEKEAPCVLDYFILKRFLTKTFDTLIFMDNSIGQNEFVGLKSITMHLENSYNEMKDRQERLNITKIFTERFLNWQCHYQALVATIDTRRNRLTSCEHQLRSTKVELKFEQGKPKPNPEKIQAKEDRIKRLTKEIAYFKETLVKLEEIRKDFYDKNLVVFEQAFKLSRDKLYQKIVTGLNLCATIMDRKIWAISLKSSGVKNSYFSKSNIEYSFCTISFAELYLSRLDRLNLNPTDQKLLSYVQKISREHSKKFLVVTGDNDLLCKIKMQIFTVNPYYVVKYAPKRVNYQSLVRENNFDVVYIDEKTVWASAADIILEGKSLDRYGTVKFKLI